MKRDTESFITRVSDALENLPPTERRLAEFMLSFPGELPSYTASELAVAARVSKPTISRFIQRLGYENYAEARRQVRIEQKHGSPLLLLDPRQERSGTLQAHLELGLTSLSETYGALDEPTLERVVQSILKSRHVWLAGFRGNYPFAAYFRWQMLRVVANSTLIPAAGETLGEYIPGFSPEDTMIIFALRRTTKASETLVRAAVRAGVKVLCITDEMTENPGPATWIVSCKTRTGGPLDNHVAVMSITHFLATRLIECSGQTGRRRMAAIEVAHTLFDEL
ncbi:MurR/RpiR family transcriptional regulator [Acetobacter fallax]|nr:MurR/RpiR family transcriptional regulator [Acetobacter fallax]